MHCQDPEPVPGDVWQIAKAYLPRYVALAMPPIMLGVGLFYTDLEQFAASVSNPTFVLICLATVVEQCWYRTLRSSVQVQLVESSMAAGLCMANMEDQATLQFCQLVRGWGSCHFLRYRPDLAGRSS